MSFEGKGHNHRPVKNPKAYDRNKSIMDENFRRKREGLPEITAAEYDAMQPRTTHAETLAFGDDPEAPLDQPVPVPNRCDHTGDTLNTTESE